MITNNNKLKGVYEVKEYQLRVFYMYASGCLVVIGANQKKSDNNKVDQAKMIACRKSAAKFVEEIKRNKDEELIAKLENEANEYIENLGTTKTL